MLKIQTAPVTNAITLVDAKTHLRVTGTGEDTYITSLISSFLSYVDGAGGILGRALVTQTWDLYLDKFPAGNGEISIPLPPLQTLDLFEYTDMAGVTQALTSSNYQLDIISEPARLVPAYGEVWPVAKEVLNAVHLRFTCGYGADDTDVPAAIKHAAKLVIGHWFENREEVVLNMAPSKVPLAAKNLLTPFIIRM